MSVSEFRSNLLQEIKYIDRKINDFDYLMFQKTKRVPYDDMYSSKFVISNYHQELSKYKTPKTIRDAWILIEVFIEKLKENKKALLRIDAKLIGFSLFDDKELLELGFSKNEITQIRNKYKYLENTKDGKDQNEIDEENEEKTKHKINLSQLNKEMVNTLKKFKINNEVINILLENIDESEQEKRMKDDKKELQEEVWEEEKSDKEEKKNSIVKMEDIDFGEEIKESDLKFKIYKSNPKTCKIRTIKELMKYAKVHSIDLGKANKRNEICEIILNHLREEEEKLLIEKNLRDKYPSIKPFGKINYQDKIPYDYVSGLLSLTVYEKPEWNKIIYLLGEQHNYKDICSSTEYSKTIDPVNLFFSLLDSTDKNLDVFLEFDYKTTKTKPQSRFSEARFSQYYNVYLTPMKGYLLQTNNILAVEGCFKGYEKSGCDYYKDHIRFHLSDVRDIDTDVNQYLHKVFHFMEYEFSNVLKDGNIQEKLNRVKNFYETVVKPNEKYNDLKIFKDEVRKALYSAKVMKQLLAIDPKYKQLETVLNEQLEYSIEHDLFVYQPKNLVIDKLINYLEKFNNTDTEDIYLLYRLKVAESEFMIRRGNLYNIYMDMYLLFRLFKTFKTTDENIKETKNVIIYSGNNHTDFYKTIFERLGFNKTFSAEKISQEEKACLDISRLKIKWL
jgi:hypothetical protein